MYVPAQNFEEEQEQEIICLYTGERYVYVDGNDKSLIDPKLVKDSIDLLPLRFFRAPFVVRTSNGQVRVFGRLD